MSAPISDLMDRLERRARESVDPNDEGLIQFPELGPIKKGLGVFVFFLTAVLLLGTAFIDTWKPVKERKVYGLEQKPWTKDRGWWTGDTARHIERYVQKHSRVRRRANSLYSIALSTHLDEGGDKVVIGRDDVYFLRGRLRFDGLEEDQAIGNTQLVVSTAARRLEAMGIPFVFLPIPRKGTLDAEYLPANYPKLTGFDSRLIRSVSDLGVETVNLLHAFADDPPDHLHYFPQDSHWGQRTRIEAMRAVGRHLRPEGVEHYSTYLTRPFAGKDPRDIQRYLGTLNEDLRTWSESTQSALQRVQPNPLMTGEPPKPLNIWLFGTSFSIDTNVSDLLGHYAAGEVRNLSVGGGDPFDGMIKAFADLKAGEPMPDVCVFEYPIHLSMAEGRNVSLYSKLGALPRAGGDLVLDMPAVLSRKPNVLKPKPALVTNRPLGTIEPARILRLPNGAVILRLRSLEPPTVPTGVRIVQGRRNLNVNWPAGERHLDVPVLTTFAGDRRVLLYLISLSNEPLDLVLDRMDLVLDVEVEPFQKAEIKPQRNIVIDEQAHWQQRLVFHPPLRDEGVKLEALLEVRTGVDTKRPFNVRAIGPDGTISNAVNFAGVVRLGYVTFPLSLFGDMDIAQLQIRGEGKAPAQFAVSAAVHRSSPVRSIRD